MKRRDLLLGAGAIVAGYGLPAEAAVPHIEHSKDGARYPDRPESSIATSSEPSVELAKHWWPQPRNVWTPVGWKDHLFRFNVVYNGSLLCSPMGWMEKPHTAQYKGNDFQLNFTPSADGTLPAIPDKDTKLYKTDGGVGVQGWREDKETPILWTDWPCQEGVVMRMEVFSHLQGGEAVKSGIEPLYAWIRLSVSYVHPINAPRQFSFGIQLSKVYYDVRGTIEDSVFLSINPTKPYFPDPLTSSILPPTSDGRPGLSISQKNHIRLHVLPGGSGSIAFKENAAHKGTYNLTVELPAKVGAHTDILVPMLAEPSDVIGSEASLGFDGALAECEQFWKTRPAAAARIHTPEKYINHAIARNIQFAQVIAERNPDTGDYSFLTGSYGYDTLWSTPTSMISHMFFDLLGYHDVVEQHLEIYKKYQGTIKPPGPAYDFHLGYFSTPKTLTSIDWLSDHGAILEAVSRHVLLTGDKAFLNKWLDPILKGCDFIKDSCAITSTSGVKGIMPPAVATDNRVPEQAIWTEAWSYKGLISAIEVLKQINHPRTPEFEALSVSFRRAFLEGFRTRMETQPEWTDAQGIKHRILPDFLAQPPEHHVFDDAFLLDTGPLVLPWAGLLDASDSDVKSLEDFFRFGPNNLLRGPQTGPISRAVLIHEIASCETCYSWNIVNSWKRGDRELFLEGMYSLFTGGISPQTYINCEHRNAMYGNVFVAPLVTWCLRQSVIDDQLDDGELHLLRLCPIAWISSQEECLFEKMPTLFGPVDLKFGLSKNGKSLDVAFNGQWRQMPRKITLHVPPLSEISQITINGKQHLKKSEIVL